MNMEFEIKIPFRYATAMDHIKGRVLHDHIWNRMKVPTGNQLNWKLAKATATVVQYEDMEDNSL